MEIYNQLETREIFHLEFLRWFGRKIKNEYYTLKGGVNLRFFFNSFRYSEDIDLDVRGIKRHLLLDAVKAVLEAKSFGATLRPFGIENVIPPDITKAKQTETTQRFKIHLITSAGEDLFTKVEFSRRGFKGGIIVEPISDYILRAYKLPPLLIPHYNIYSTVLQKTEALGRRTITQARDIFDLYVLSSQYERAKTESIVIRRSALKRLHDKIFEIGFERFRDTVVFYLSAEDRERYNNPQIWDEVRLKAVNFLEELCDEKKA